MWDWVRKPFSAIAEKVSEGIWGFLSEVVSDLLTQVFDLLSETILKTNNLNAYIDVSRYLIYVQIIAGSLLALVVANEIFKNLSGLSDEDISIGTYIFKIIWSGSMIYFLPWVVENVLLKANELLIKLIIHIGVDVNVESFSGALQILNAQNVGNTMILAMLVFVIAWAVLGVIGGIRYVELVIGTIISPIVALSFVRKGEGFGVWIREMIAIVFTQAIHFLLLQIMLGIIGTIHNPLMAIVLSIAVMSAMIKGPQTLRKFLYSSGTASASVSAMGQVTRMKTMKMMMTK